MSVELREATADDADGIVDVARESWYAAYGGFLDPAGIESEFETAYDPELVRAALESEEIVLHVAVDDGIVGFASAERTWADEVELHTIHVHPDRWGEGIGSALFDRVEAWARRRDVDHVACGVFVENVVAVGFFEALGFLPGDETTVEFGGSPRIEREYALPL